MSHSNDSHFLYHEPCPRCGSRDNLGVWNDGHKYCFGCRYYIPGLDTLDSIRRKISLEQEVEGEIDTSDYIYTIPHPAKGWLEKYGISEGEIYQFGLAWNKKTESLVLPVKDGNKVVLSQERYFGSDPSRPKYITYGKRNSSFLFVLNSRYPNSVIFTEDYLSAVKVGRICSAVPVLGCTMPANALKWAVGRFSKVRIWYDMDKATESVTEASKVSQYVKDTRSIITQLDPKEYTSQEILNVLRKYDVVE